jgi:hypothetical protein
VEVGEVAGGEALTHGAGVVAPVEVHAADLGKQLGGGQASRMGLWYRRSALAVALVQAHWISPCWRPRRYKPYGSCDGRARVSEDQGVGFFLSYMGAHVACAEWAAGVFEVQHGHLGISGDAPAYTLQVPPVGSQAVGRPDCRPATQRAGCCVRAESGGRMRHWQLVEDALVSFLPKGAHHGSTWFGRLGDVVQQPPVWAGVAAGDGLGGIEPPRSARRLPGGTPLRAIVSAKKASASSADSAGATSQPGTERLKMSITAYSS